ncbi:hypothetical protein CPB83DRAFT_881687 [Crepidotus variabilis]|uniref:Uncharacterized protein n=1 Tax=Crepidotus variabilis TaxID=179855 RepID=A0A9P6JSV5_9AGAR|nr:hypothetical protein CPB83DRAFT_881687 [Crepidotus variabilis]
MPRAFDANDQDACKNMVLKKAKFVHGNCFKKMLEREIYAINMWMTVPSQRMEGITIGQIWHADLIQEHILIFLYYAASRRNETAEGVQCHTLIVFGVGACLPCGSDPIILTAKSHELLTFGGLYNKLQAHLINSKQLSAPYQCIIQNSHKVADFSPLK